MSAREKVAAAIAELVGVTGVGSLKLADAAIAAHLEHLAETGHAVIKLPEPCETTVLNCAWWLAGDVTATVGSGRVRCELDDHRMSSDNARDLAAALLAAADAAETQR